jgi:hypothetical protein
MKDIKYIIFVVTEKEKMMEEEEMPDKLEIDWGPKVTTTNTGTTPSNGKWSYYNGHWYKEDALSEKSKEPNSQEWSLMRIANALDHIAELMDKYAEWLHIQ